MLNCFDVCKQGNDNFDSDGDGIPDDCDNCVLVPNPDQRDSDGDRRGDACAGDFDGDGIGDLRDNCDQLFNIDQRDTDGDGVGDGCDDDDDDDGVIDTFDLCAGTPIGAMVSEDGCATGPVSPVGEQPDLRVELEAELFDADTAPKIRYTVTVTNLAEATARNVSIKATLDATTTLDDASNGGQPSDNKVLWPGFDLAGGGVIVRTYIVRVEVTDDGGNEIGGIVDVGSDDDDRNPVDNQDISGVHLIPNNSGTREQMCGAGAETPVAVASMLLMLTRLLPSVHRRRRHR